MLHETNRNIKSIGKAPIARHRTPAAGASALPGCQDGWGRPSVCAALESSVPGERKDRASVQTTSRQARQTLKKAERGINKGTLERGDQARIHHRLMDLSTYCPGSRPSFPGVLPCALYWAVAGLNELELPETRRTAVGTERINHSAMGEKGLAPYKKKPGVGRPALFSLMKRAFACCRPCAEPGRPKGKRRSTGTGWIVIRRFPVSVGLAFRRTAESWDFIWDCTRTRMLPRKKPSGFLKIWRDILEVRLYWCGTVRECIGVNKFKDLLTRIAGLSWNICLLMRRILIPSTTFGAILNIIAWLTRVFQMLTSCASAYAKKLTVSATLKTFWYRLSMRQNYLCT